MGHSKGDKRIALGQITAVEVRPAGRLANGFIPETDESYADGFFSKVTPRSESSGKAAS